MYNDKGGKGAIELNLSEVEFIDNEAVTGGGLYGQSVGEASSSGSDTLTERLDRVKFTRNRAENGGGIYLEIRYQSASLFRHVYSNLVFTANEALSNGGAVCYKYRHTPGGCNTSPTKGLYFVNSLFHGNTASLGGGIYMQSVRRQSEHLLFNDVFVKNRASDGGGIFIFASNDSTTGQLNQSQLINVSFGYNRASGTGGGMAIHGGKYSFMKPTITNAVFWGNRAGEGAQIYDDRARYSYIWEWEGDLERRPAPVINYSLIQGGCPEWALCGDVLLDEGPFFIGRGKRSLLRLGKRSPAINAGTNEVLPVDQADLDGDGDFEEQVPYDFLGNDRVQCNHVDMGAYEYDAVKRSRRGRHARRAK
ncbi:MAG: hypothetical protein D3910_13115 [Candidatus Electrothrix sp. ATG2]|nr:hypothetical protein [Candidatus Electrothrix sp. ATG2]